MKEPSVSIILVNYNGSQDTIECIESVLKCDYKNYNIIVVDNASNDYQELNNNPVFENEKVILIRSDENLGFSGGNNIGIKYVSETLPDYVLLLNNDTIVTKGFLSALVESAKKNKNVGIVTGKILYYWNKDTIWFAGGEYSRKNGRTVHCRCDMKDDSDTEKKICTFATGCLQLISKDALQKVGLLSEEYFLYSEDVDYCCRIIDAGYSIMYDPSCVIYHKVSASTGKNSRMKQYYMMRNEIAIIRKYSTKKRRALFSTYMKYGKRFLKRKLDFYAMRCAIRDAKAGRMGKVDSI